MEVRCFHALAEIEALRTEINAVNLASERSDPFSTFEFLANFIRRGEFASMNNARLWFLAAFVDHRLIGYLALKSATHRFLWARATKIDCLIAHEGDRPHVVAGDADINKLNAAFYAYLLQRKREWSFLELQQQDRDSTLAPAAEISKSNAYLISHWPNMPNCTIHIRWQTVHNYFRAMTKKSRSNISRQARALLAAGDVEVLSSSDPDTTPALYELYLNIEQRSWKSHAKLSLASRAGQADYFRGLLDARQPMRLSIQILLLDGMPIAGMINGSFDGAAAKKLYALHIVYDRRFSSLAPGSAILLMGVRQAIIGGYALYNLLSGFGYYKTRWLADVAETHSVQCYRKGGLFYWRRIFGDLKRRFSKKAKFSEPELFNTARREVIADESEPGVGNESELTVDDRERCSELIAQARRGKGEFLSHAEVAAVMPFATERESPRAFKTVASNHGIKSKLSVVPLKENAWKKSPRQNRSPESINKSTAKSTISVNVH